MSVHKLDSLVWGRVCQCVTDEWFFQRTLTRWREQGYQAESQHLANVKASEGALAKLGARARNLT
jgi:hypothetical protein